MDIQDMIARHTDAIIRGDIRSPDIVCRSCHQKPAFFKLHESRKRQFRLIVEDIVTVTMSFLLRWRCLLCRATFTEYPSFAVPHKRFVLTDIITLGQRYLEHESSSYRHVVLHGGANIGYPDAGGLCDRFLSHSSVWRYMFFLSDMASPCNDHPVFGPQMLSIPSFKYHSDYRKGVLFRAVKGLILLIRRMDFISFPDFETGHT